MAEYCPSCGETLAANATFCTFCGTSLASTTQAAVAEPSLVLLAPVPAPPAPLVAQPPPPIIVVQSPIAPTSSLSAQSPRNPTTALYLEFLGMIGFLGIGQIYAGRVPLGIVALVVWACLYLPPLLILGGIVGIAALNHSNWSQFLFCLLIPALLVCLFSGLSARDYLRKQQVTG